MKFAIVLYKLLDIGMILGIAVISILMSWIAGGIIADCMLYGTDYMSHMETLHVTASDAKFMATTSWISMAIATIVAVPLVYKCIRKVIKAEIEA